MTASPVTLPPAGLTLIGVLLRNRVILLAFPLIGMLVGVTVALATPANYEAALKLVVAPTVETSADTSIRALDTLDSQNRLVLNSIAELAEGRSVSRLAHQRASVDAEVPLPIHADLDEEANLLVLSAVGADDHSATAVAIAAAEVTIEQAGAIFPLYVVEQVGDPSPPESSARPRLLLALLASAVIGVVAALGVVNARFLRGRRGP